MKTFLIDDEAALCRYLAARTWTNDYMSASDKELQFKMQRENDLERQNRPAAFTGGAEFILELAKMDNDKMFQAWLWGNYDPHMSSHNAFFSAAKLKDVKIKEIKATLERYKAIVEEIKQSENYALKENSKLKDCEIMELKKFKDAYNEIEELYFKSNKEIKALEAKLEVAVKALNQSEKGYFL